MDVKNYLNQARTHAGKGFRNAKVWRFEAISAVAKELGLNPLIKEDKNKVRNQLRVIRDYQFSRIEKENPTEKDFQEFLQFMEDFLESGITCFDVHAVLAPTTISSALKGDASAKAEVARAEGILQKVKKFMDSKKKK